ncbi:uncharacterized protein FRV6_07199 [Fusarium oxysporum]|uniref:Uncharacterized protein n=1 Tax=Fusarium oxysporum TaxID=5507 RepID=A0A2H3T2S2_FUSOX|nr:uncharacterized protein FRV6_07199 [Fusarium oxysporum]
MISCPPHKHCPKPRFKLTRYITEKNLALLDPEDFLSQALRYYQNYLQHKELHLPESETYQTSFVEMPSEARSEPQDPTQAARKRRLGDDYDPDESSRQGYKRVRVSQESHKRGIKGGFSAIV